MEDFAMANPKQKIEQVEVATDGAIGRSQMVNEVILPDIDKSLSIPIKIGDKVVSYGVAEVKKAITTEIATAKFNAPHEGELKKFETAKMGEIVLGIADHVDNAISNSSLKNAEQSVKAEVLKDVYERVFFRDTGLSKTNGDTSFVGHIYNSQQNAVKYYELCTHKVGENMTEWKKVWAIADADAFGVVVINVNTLNATRKRLNKKLSKNYTVGAETLKSLQVVEKKLGDVISKLEIEDEAFEANKKKAKKK
jgi:hypothetical protein